LGYLAIFCMSVFRIIYTLYQRFLMETFPVPEP
jgi:hypothetical protein